MSIEPSKEVKGYREFIRLLEEYEVPSEVKEELAEKYEKDEQFIIESQENLDKLFNDLPENDKKRHRENIKNTILKREETIRRIKSKELEIIGMDSKELLQADNLDKVFNKKNKKNTKLNQQLKDKSNKKSREEAKKEIIKNM